LAGALHAGAFAGRIVEDHTGNPLALAEVRVANAAGVIAELETDSAGRFHGPELAPGEYRVEVSKPNYIGANLAVAIGPAAAPLGIRLVRSGVIAGRVTDANGQPAAGAQVYTLVKAAAQAGGGAGSGAGGSAALRPTGSPVTVDSRGQYRIYGLPPGQYAVAAAYGVRNMAISGGILFYPNSQRPRIFTVSGGEEYSGTDFNVVTGAVYGVTGVVLLPKPGMKFALALTTADQPALPFATQETEPGGAFRFEGVMPGSYELLVSGPKNGYTATEATLGPRPFFGRAHVEVSQNVEGLSVAVAEGRSVEVILRAAQDSHAGGGCPAGTQVSMAALEAWGAMVNRTAEVNTTKAQTVTQLAPGSYRLTATRLGDTCYSAGNPVVDLSKPAPPAPIAVTVATAGGIRGRLIAGGAQAAPSPGSAAPMDFAVILLPPEEAGNPQAVQIAFPDAERRFAFATLPPGRYRIGAQPAAEAAKARWVPDLNRMAEIDVAGGAPTDLELQVPSLRGQ
jgi:hypothetical protein